MLLNWNGGEKQYGRLQAVQEAVPGWLTTVAPTASRPYTLHINRGIPDKEVRRPAPPLPPSPPAGASVMQPRALIHPMSVATGSAGG